jgi:hypothetical protein
VLMVGASWRTGEDGGARVTRGDGPRVADARDQGEAGPGVSGGVQERAKRREAGWRQGANMRAQAAQCQPRVIQTRFETKSDFKRFKQISNCFKQISL